MVNIEVKADTGQHRPSQERARSVFALGWVRFKSASNGQPGSAEDEMRVLGVMVVQDSAAPCPVDMGAEDRKF